MKISRSILGRLALFCATLIWGTSFVVLKNALDNISTLWILAIRFSGAAALMALIAGRRVAVIDRKILSGGIKLGLCLAAAYIVQTYGLVYTSPGKNAFLTSTYCVLTPFLAWVITRESPGIARVFAAMICLVGIGFVSLESGYSNLNFGDVLTLLSGIFYALLIILMNRYVANGETLVLSAIEFAAAAAVCWIAALIFEPAPAHISGDMWLSLAYMSFVCTGVCFFLQAWGVMYTPTSAAAVILTFEAVFGALFSVILYHETLSAKILIGFVLIFGSVILSELNPKLPKQKKKP